MSSLWDVDQVEEPTSLTDEPTDARSSRINCDQIEMIKKLTARLEALEAAWNTSDARMEQVEACRNVSDAKVKLLESKLRSSEAKIEEQNAKLKASEAQVGLFKTYLKASDEKVKQLLNDVESLKAEIKAIESKQVTTDEVVQINAAENERLEREQAMVNTGMTNNIEQLRMNEQWMRQQILLSCVDMQETRNKLISLSFNHPLTPTQQDKVNDELWEAAKQGNVDMIRSALDNGAQMNCIMNKGHIGKMIHNHCSPLFVASSQGHSFAVEYLILRGSDINIVNDAFSTALNYACAEGHNEVISVLLDYGAEINKTNKDNWIPLHYASSYGNVSTVRLLLKKGADVSAKNNEGKTAYDEAGRSNPSQKSTVQSVFHEFIKK